MKSARLLNLIYILLFSYSALSNATVVLNIQDGTLTGATGVNVNGSLYDVSFQEGTCAELFRGCNEASDFFFPVTDLRNTTVNASLARLASQALLDQVFTNSSLGQFDSVPNLTFGCYANAQCSVLTPILDSGSANFASVYVVNKKFEHLDTATGFGSTPITGDTQLSNQNADGSVFAIWSNNVATVPVPTAVWLFSSGLIGLIGMREKS